MDNFPQWFGWLTQNSQCMNLLTNGFVGYNKDFFQADAIINQYLCPNLAMFNGEWRRNM